MANGRNINIQFPFVDSTKGFYLGLTTTDKEAIRSDLMHLILTKKGERLYLPDFGTNLLKYIFEPNDNLSHTNLTQEIKDTVKKYIPNLQINSVKVTTSNSNEHVAITEINYTITEDVFETTDTLIITI